MSVVVFICAVRRNAIRGIILHVISSVGDVW